MEVIDLLRRVRELLADPARWTTRFFARDNAGEAVGVSDPNATCWCVEGAIRYLAAGDLPLQWGAADALDNTIMDVARNVPLDPEVLGGVDVNDKQGYYAVHHALDLTIERLEAQAR